MKVTIEGLETYLEHHYGARADDQGLFMKLVEEIGEVAEVLNQRSGRKAADEPVFAERLGEELADVLHYTIAIAAVNHLDLNDIILKKDKAASIKYHHDVDLETFLGKEQSNNNDRITKSV